jgi:hypothetical protein
MPNLINNETGLAESLDLAKANEALKKGSHAVPLVSPEGEPVHVSLADAPGLVAEGYRQPNREEHSKLLRYAKASTPKAEAISAVEGFAQGLLPGATGLETKLLGVDPQDIADREEANPGHHLTGKLAGTGASFAVGPLAAIKGGALVRNAVQAAVMQGGDEAHKMFLGDPHQSVETALTNVGLSAALGGGLGAALGRGGNALLNINKDAKLTSILTQTKDAVQSVNNVPFLPDLIEHLPFGRLAMFVGRKAGKAIDMAVKHAMGAEGEASAQGFRAMVDLAHNIVKGENLTASAVKGIFLDNVKEVLPKASLPDEGSSSKLEKLVSKAQMDPMSLASQNEGLSHYMPEAAGAMGEAMGRAVNYLATIKPPEDKMGPLDPKRVPSKSEQVKYQRALEVAEQPLVTMQRIKDGSLTAEDIHTMQAIYPTLLDSLRQQVTNRMADHVAEGGIVPMPQAMAISMFLGQPLKSALMPQNIVSNQSIYAPQPPPGSQKGPKNANKGALNNLSSAEATPSQAREQQRRVIK